MLNLKPHAEFGFKSHLAMLNPQWPTQILNQCLSNYYDVWSSHTGLKNTKQKGRKKWILNIFTFWTVNLNKCTNFKFGNDNTSFFNIVKNCSHTKTGNMK